MSFVSVVLGSCTRHLFTASVVISSIHFLSTTWVFCSVSRTLRLFSSMSSLSAIVCRALFSDVCLYWVLWVDLLTFHVIIIKKNKKFFI